MTEKTPTKRGLKAGILILIIIGGFLVLGVIGALVGNYVVMPIIVGRGYEIEVPEVVGLRVDDAIIALKERGFEAAPNERRPDTLYEEGTVIEQKPRAGSKVKKGRQVQLVVSSGAELVRVPYLLNLTVEQALMIAERHRFEIEAVDTVSSDSVQSGRIVSMKPDPEIRVVPGTKLHLYISAGPADKTIPVPNVIDLPVERARALLEADSLVLGEIRSMPVKGKGGIVILQSPEPGFLMAAGDTVNLTVGQEQ